MLEPATGPVAASSAVAIPAISMWTLGKMMPASSGTMIEFVIGMFFAACGAFAFQFIRAQDARQKAADQGMAIESRPRIDRVLVAYAMCGAPLSAVCFIFCIHKMGGSTGFGDATFFQSAAGFMAAGAMGPPFVMKVVGYLNGLVTFKAGGKDNGGKP